VSRWMTWLPISLKNAAKCDKWYQLQNHPITESLNANGAWKKTLVVQLQACHVSVSNKNQPVLETRCRFCAWRRFASSPVQWPNSSVVPASVGSITGETYLWRRVRCLARSARILFAFFSLLSSSPCVSVKLRCFAST